MNALWYGASPLARVARTALRPLASLYAAVVRARNRRADAGEGVYATAIPALSIGNLTVGGTGKTPLAAWAVARLRERGATPALVMRGYGDDEPLVHARLNPGVRVVTNADRVRGIASAAADGADVAVLDDAFQHRRAARHADWVLVAAESFRSDLDVLPAGPLREPLSGLARAAVVIVTRKSADEARSQTVAAQLRGLPGVRDVARVHLAPDLLVDAVNGAARDALWLRNRPVLVTAAIAAPAAFLAQLRALGAVILGEDLRRDHSPYGPQDVTRLRERGATAEAIICTLKDAVKLGPLWGPAAPPLLYVSQSVRVEEGAALLNRSLDDLLSARTAGAPNAGDAGPRA